ncbi:MAG: 3-oxoacyl-[acyl-carrier protein] reductase [Candidatus Sumerlaeota bacterium]|nr:3-oxoacyl-[acyl-carrier protein] reductase [Candidatus Sumerlaeota bacterium]
MDLQLTGHAAIVQGGSAGIGRGIAESLAAEGCDIVLAARNAAPLEKAAAEIAAASGRRVVCETADSADLASAERLVERARSEFGRLDILVCNSGGPAPGKAMDLASEQWIDAAHLLIASPVALLKAAMPLLERSPAPRFFVVTSSSTCQPVAGLTLSNVYRPGVVGLIKTLADELGASGLRCHSLAPGRVDTQRLANVIAMQARNAGKEPEAVRKDLLATIPAGRLGEPADLGALAAFLASPKADYLTGGNWLVDGGFIKCL